MKYKVLIIGYGSIGRRYYDLLIREKIYSNYMFFQKDINQK